jgi:hypothetical protein
VRGFEPQGQFVWCSYDPFGDDLDNGGSGLVRFNLQELNADTPAWAPDLDGEGAYGVATTYGFDRRVFVGLSGIWWESDEPVASGWLDTGRFTWNISDPKIVEQVSVRHDAFSGTHQIEVAADGGDWTDLGTITESGTLSGRGVTGEAFALRHTLTPVTDGEPAVARWTLRSEPYSSGAAQQIIVPLILRAEEENLIGTKYQRDCAASLAWLKSLQATGATFTYQEGHETYLCRMRNFQWNPQSHLPDGSTAGVFTAVLKTITGT